MSRTLTTRMMKSRNVKDHSINKDSISEFRRLGNQRSKERGSLTSRTRDMRNREIILVVGSRTNLGRQTHEVNVANHVSKDR